MFKVGILGSENSHALAFAQLANLPDPATGEYRYPDMRITAICGYYYKTAKNAMVKDLFGTFGFTKTEQFENGDSTWRMEIAGYENQNHVIQVNEKEHQQA